MFGKKQRIIETQKALIMDLQQYHNDLVRENARLMKENESMKHFISVQSSEIHALKTINKVTDIDFPNSLKEEPHTIFGVINISDILNL